MRSKNGIAVLAAALAAAWIGVASAQDGEPARKPEPVSEEKAREALGDWLTKGALAPAEGETHAVALKGVERQKDLESDRAWKGDHPGMTFGRNGSFLAVVDRKTADVTYFMVMRPLFHVEERAKDGTKRTAEDRKAELEKRAKFSLEEDVKRATTFLESHYPDFAHRTFEVERKERLDRDSLVEDELVFVERPRKGVLACWPNRIEIAMNPENGRITSYLAHDRRLESRDEPRLTKEEARKKVLEAYGSRVKPENREFLEKKATVVLVATERKGASPRTTWLVAGRLCVDAITGELGTLAAEPAEGE